MIALVDELAQALASNDPDRIDRAVAGLAWAHLTNRHTLTTAINTTDRPLDPDALASIIEGIRH
jgi:hypothetical protein